MGRCAGVEVGEVREEVPVPDDEVWERESRPALDAILSLCLASYTVRLSYLLFCLLFASFGECIIACSSSITV